jgi:histone-lysine N-methyltransferase SETD3
MMSISITESGSDAGTLKERGDALFRAHKYKAALEQYKLALTAVAQATDQTEEARALRCKILSNRAALLAAERKWGQSLVDAKRLTSESPTFAKGWYRLGFALEGLVKLPEAVQAYQNALELDSACELYREAVARVEVLAIPPHEDGKHADSAAFDALIEWLRSHKAAFPALYMRRYGPEHRGVHCLTNVDVNNVVLYVPKACIMSLKTAQQCRLMKAIGSGNIKVASYHTTMAVYLLEEKLKGKHSHFYPYINILPKAYDTIPTGFTEQQKQQWLKGSFCLRKITQRNLDLQNEHKSLSQCKQYRDTISYEDFVWARQVVITRIFGYGSGETKDSGLVPYADMLNHKLPCETSWMWEKKKNGFIIKTTTPLARGAEVFDSYGRKCNSRFFVNYGFSIDENTDNEAHFDYKASRNEQIWATYCQPHKYNIHSFEGGIVAFQIPATYDHDSTKVMFQFLRCRFAKVQFRVTQLNSISKSNERQTLRAVRACALEMLAQFDTSLQQDNVLLDSGTLTLYSNERNSVVMRRGEKQVLTWFVTLADTCLPLLDCSWDQLKTQILAWRNIPEQHAGEEAKFELYASQALVPLFCDIF